MPRSVHQSAPPKAHNPQISNDDLKLFAQEERDGKMGSQVKSQSSILVRCGNHYYIFPFITGFLVKWGIVFTHMLQEHNYIRGS